MPFIIDRTKNCALAYNMTKKTKGQVTEVDKLIGKRLKTIRLLNDCSQAELAEKLNLTFQQIQKYEKGTNRISASRLYEIAEIFDVNLYSFFDQIPPTNSEPLIPECSELHKIIKMWPQIQTHAEKKLLTRMTKRLTPTQSSN